MGISLDSAFWAFSQVCSAFVHRVSLPPFLPTRKLTVCYSAAVHLEPLLSLQQYLAVAASPFSVIT